MLFDPFYDCRRPFNCLNVSWTGLFYRNADGHRKISKRGVVLCLGHYLRRSFWAALSLLGLSGCLSSLPGCSS